MHLLERRHRTAERIIIVVLALSFVGFSVWLKMLPNLVTAYRTNSPESVKLWVDPSHDSDSQVKLALMGGLLLAITLVPALVARPALQFRPVQILGFSARDIFIKSRHWFRPPPRL